ncbi:hypothetical protein [Acuticoccus kandeliae]|uniref:hypothetical protein n=1 Tax=Acuticoccus kandeliae TaxID=2073160 RepID=UPI000D3EDE68|nr:hypothetical protein [Acuticoccus kandeliae]
MSKTLLTAAIIALTAATAGTALARGNDRGGSDGANGNDAPSIQRIERLTHYPPRQRYRQHEDVCQHRVRTGNDAMLLLRRCDAIGN